MNPNGFDEDEESGIWEPEPDAEPEPEPEAVDKRDFEGAMYLLKAFGMSPPRSVRRLLLGVKLVANEARLVLPCEAVSNNLVVGPSIVLIAGVESIVRIIEVDGNAAVLTGAGVGDGDGRRVALGLEAIEFVSEEESLLDKTAEDVKPGRLKVPKVISSLDTVAFQP